MNTPLLAGLSGFQLVGIAAVLSALGVLIRLARKAWPILRRVSHFADDWFGEPDRDGVPGRPGVMKRLQTVDQRLDTIEHELKPNSGQSLRDAVDRVEAAITPDDKNAR